MRKALALVSVLVLPAAAEDGKALVERWCTNCHKQETTMRQRNTRERWSAIVDNMVSRGMEASDAEIEKIIDYLARTQGAPLPVNKATAEELAAALEVPASTGEAIVAYRVKNGAFKTLEELKRVPALNGKNIDGKKDSITFE